MGTLGVLAFTTGAGVILALGAASSGEVAVVLAATLSPAPFLALATRARGRSWLVRLGVTVIISIGVAVLAAWRCGEVLGPGLLAASWAIGVAWLARFEATRRIPAERALAVELGAWVVAAAVGSAAAASMVIDPPERWLGVWVLAGVVAGGLLPLRVAAAEEEIEDAFRRFARPARRARSRLGSAWRRLRGASRDVDRVVREGLSTVERRVAAEPARAADATATLLSAWRALDRASSRGNADFAIARSLRRVGGAEAIERALRGPAEAARRRVAAVRAVLDDPVPADEPAAAEVDEAARIALMALAGSRADRLKRAGAAVRQALHDRYKRGGLSSAGRDRRGSEAATSLAIAGLREDLTALSGALEADPFVEEREALADSRDELTRLSLARRLERPLQELARLLWVDVATILLGAIRAAQEASERPIDAEIGDTVPALTAAIPPGALRDAVLNLLWNAVAAARSAVRLRAEMQAGTLQIEVSDDGEGLSADRFAVAVAAPGGLGLARRRVVDDLGGTLELSAEGPPGTTVRVRIPLG